MAIDIKLPIAVLLLVVFFTEANKRFESDGEEAIGPCVNGLCPDGHRCIKEHCYPVKKTARVFQSFKKRQPPRDDKIGPCIGGLCPAAYQCIDDGCYLKADESGSTVD